jgi:hypothetical protein
VIDKVGGLQLLRATALAMTYRLVFFSLTCGNHDATRSPVFYLECTSVTQSQTRTFSVSILCMQAPLALVQQDPAGTSTKHAEKWTGQE